MNIANLTFTQKIIAVIFSLVLLVSVALMLSTMLLFASGKKQVQQGVAEKLGTLRAENMQKISEFSEVANEAVRQSSGLSSIENIVTISTENQESFIEAVHSAITETGDSVSKAVLSQSAIISEGLDGLLAVSTDSMDDIMAADSDSMNVLTNVAAFHLNSLTTSSLDSLERFTHIIGRFEQQFLNNQTVQNDAIDDFLIQLITILDESGQADERLVESIVTTFEELKEQSLERQQQLYRTLKREFTTQANVVGEELTLVNQNVQYAINLGLAHATATQEEQIDTVISTLLENQFTIQDQIALESQTLTQTVTNLRTELPAQLQQEGADTLQRINEQSRKASETAENAKSGISLRIQETTDATAQKFEAGIAETQQVITDTLNQSSARTLSLSLTIAALCVAFSIAAGVVSARALTQPLSRTAHLVKNISNGDFSETAEITSIAKSAARNDEIGILANAVIDMRRVLGDVLQETAGLIRAIQEGRLDTRSHTEAFSGDWRTLMHDLNAVIDAFVAPINVTAEYLDRIAKGDIPARITEDYRGDFNEIKNNLNQCIDAIGGLVDETARLTGATVAGQLEARGISDGFSGDFAKIVDGINATLNAVVGPLNAAADYVNRIAKGEIPEEIQTTYNGDFNTIKNNLNGLIRGLQELTQAARSMANGDMSVTVHKRSDADVLAIAFQQMGATFRQVLAEIRQLIQSALDGELSMRGESKHYQGDFAQIMSGINKMMDAIVGPLTLSAEYIERLSKGDIPDRILTEFKGDFNAIKENLNMLIASTNDVTTLAHEIAEGNLNVHVEPRSEQDALMKTLQIMVAYLHDVADVTERISNKDLQVSVTPKSGHDVLNQSLQTMVATLQTMMGDIESSMAEVQQQNWFRTGQAELSDIMRGEQSMTELAKNIITYLSTHLDAKVGAMYLSDDEQTAFQLVASYAYTVRKGDRSRIQWGDGLIGQAALEKQSILFMDVPDNYLTISSGLGETTPGAIMVVPFLYEDAVKGVVELGSASRFTTTQQDFLTQMTESIAIAFHSAQTRGQLHELLEATQQQTQTLQTQQESLRVANEEMEAQTQALRESEQKLQSQQEELRQTNEELEQQAKALEQQQRTLQKNNADLQKAQTQVEEKARDLEMANTYKSEFLANMSHELRTPLNSLLILAKLLQGNKTGNLTEKQLEFARTIHSSGTELLELINEILDLSKLEAGKMEIQIGTMSLKGILNYIKQHFGHVVKQKEITLTIRLARNLPDSMRTDQQRVEQIIKNLLSNAIKFTSKGGIMVTISRPDPTTNLTFSGLQPQNAVAFAVTDTGVGIPEEKQQLIFEAFSQADGSTSRRYGGTGLGLSITRELTKLLGGEVQLKSQAGVGSTFTLYLPEEHSQPEHASQSEASSLFPTSPPGRGKGWVAQSSGIPVSSTHLYPSQKGNSGSRSGSDSKKLPPERGLVVSSDDEKWLLIIEDDPKFAKIFTDLAHAKGFKCLHAAEGAEGLRLAAQQMPDAVILDLGLPDMDGRQVIEQLKQNSETQHIPIQVISASDVSAETLKMGAIGYQTKPVTLQAIDEVFDTIHSVLAGSNKKLLIVENDHDLRNSMVELLDRDDIHITTASAGEEAYQMVQSEHFDLMVLDLGLEDISGFDLLEKIQENSALAQLAVIVYTGRELTKDEELTLKKSAQTIIVKGLKADERLLDEVTLFLHHVDAHFPEEQRHKPRIHHDKEDQLQNKLVLVVDDDMRNVFALSNVLEEKGMIVVIAENGKEALERLDAQKDIHIVLMDIMMSEMDGYETMRRIRQIPELRKLPIIALTAKAMKGDRQKCIDAGANDYLPKPLNIDKLLSLLRIWLY